MSSLSKKVLSLVLGACIVATLFAASMVPASAKVDTTKFTEDFTDSTLEQVLTYTDNDGTTSRDDFVISSLDNFEGKKFLTWSNADTTVQAGINQRLNIAKELSNGSKLTSFSFKMPLYSSANKYHPAYILFGQDSETTQKAMVVGGRHNDAMIGYSITSIPLAPDSEVSHSGDAWNTEPYTGNLAAEDQKVLVTYTVSINWANNTATVAFSKPAADGVEGSYGYALSGSKTINFADFQDVYFAVSAGRLNYGSVYITDVETTYEYEYVSHDWIKQVNPNTADAEKVLSYTAADGQTAMEPVVTDIAGANAVTWNSKSTTGVSGERHQRINIASEKNGVPLTSFSFKSLVVSSSAKATPVYVLFGSTEGEANQVAVGLGGRHDNRMGYQARNVANPATGEVNGTTAVFNGGSYDKDNVVSLIEAEIGKQYYRYNVKLLDGKAEITVENLDADGNVEWTATAQKAIDLSTVANPYYAISSGWADPYTVYVTDIQPVYAEPEMLGATIRKTASASEQDIMFGSQIKIAESVADGYTPAGYGMLLARTADIQGAAMTADVENANVTNLYHEAGADTDFTYTVTINKSAVAGYSGKKFSARAYVKYVKAGEADIYVYSEQIAKSVYGYAKDMAADVIANGNVAENYTLSDETVVNYVEANINAAINGISKDAASFDAEHKNEDHLLAFIYANKDYNA